MTQTNCNITPHDRDILRDLALTVRVLSARPIEIEKRRLWYQHNSLQPTRPLIFCDPENGWNEIITESHLQCKTPLTRNWERTLQKEIFWGEKMQDDRVIEPYFNLPYIYEETDWGLHEQKIGGEDGGAYKWDPPLKDYKDLDKLRYPEIIIDYEKTNLILELAQETLGDILEVRLKGHWWWTLGMTWTLINLRGMENMMLDFYENPQELHALMAFLRDGHLHKLDFLESHNLLSLNNDGTYVGSGGFGWTHELPSPDFNGTQVRTKDIWGFAESQETSTISPAMFAEFVLPYQIPVLKRFGLNCYGCCEPLEKRWDPIQMIPHLRRVSVSPWANLEEMSEKLGTRYIYSMKPNPTHLAVPLIDEPFIRHTLKQSLELTRDNIVEVIMKDNHTIGNNPDNVIQWCQIAKEIALSL